MRVHAIQGLDMTASPLLPIVFEMKITLKLTLPLAPRNFMLPTFNRAAFSSDKLTACPSVLPFPSPEGGNTEWMLSAASSRVLP